MISLRESDTVTTYVDDLAVSIPEKRQAIQLYETAAELFARGSFKLRKWISNSEELMSRFGQEGVSVEEFTGEDAKEFKVLGFRYDRKKDTLRLGKPKLRSIDQILTKRKVLSIVSSVFDRLGMVAPVMVRAKLIMQQIYKIPSIKWNDVVPDSIASAV